jgi:hypothetical protein
VAGRVTRRTMTFFGKGFATVLAILALTAAQFLPAIGH